MSNTHELKNFDTGEIDELTQLLLGASREELWSTWSPANDAEFLERLTSSLTEAISQIQDKAGFRAAIAPVIVNGVLDTARRQPQQIGDALAPALGPAIRSLIKLSLDEMNERIESGLQRTLSIEGLKWRWQSMRTGVAFSHVVLQNTRRFRVEHVMLIHRTSGTLLCDLARPDYSGKDASVVASMLTVVTEFIGEAFSDSSSSDYRQIEVGGLVVKVEALGDLVMASVVYGSPTSQLHQQMRVTLEAVNEGFSHHAADFRGDTEPFDAAEHYLAECLIEKKLESPERDSKPRKVEDQASKSRRTFLFVAFLIAFGAWQWNHYQHSSLWKADLERIGDLPGVVVLGVENTGSFWKVQHRISGLLDPDALHPSTVITKSQGSVAWNLSSYLSLDADVVLRRAERVLRVPSTVLVELEGSVLVLSGVADASWIDSLEGAQIQGVNRISTNNLSIRSNRTRFPAS